MDESFIGGFRTQPPSFAGPPPLPPKDFIYNAPHKHIQSTISTSQLTHMSAVERSQTLRVARMEPHLQVFFPSFCLLNLSHISSSCAVLSSSMSSLLI